MKEKRAVFVAQLVERSLLTPEVCGSNPVIDEIYIEHCLLSTEAGNGPFFLKKTMNEKGQLLLSIGSRNCSNEMYRSIIDREPFILEPVQ